MTDPKYFVAEYLLNYDMTFDVPGSPYKISDTTLGRECGENVSIPNGTILENLLVPFSSENSP